jgi:hypothetical protein
VRPSDAQRATMNARTAANNGCLSERSTESARFPNQVHGAGREKPQRSVNMRFKIVCT